RSLGFLDAAALHVGTIVGSGIFVAPAMVAGAVTTPAAGALFWILGGLIAACGAACYAECGSRLPHAGGFYVTYRTVYGPALAFVGGWVAVVVTYPASTAAIALVFGSYLAEVVPVVQGHETLAAAAAVVASAGLNIAGVPLAAGVQRVLSGTKLLALAAICLAAVIAAGAIGGGPATGAAAPAAVATASSEGEGGLFGAAIIVALMVMLFTYDGWSDISLIAGEVRDAGRVLGPAVLAASAAIVLVYAAVQWSVMVLLPGGKAASAQRVVADAVMAGLGTGAGRIVALLVAVSAFGSVHSIVLGSSRIGYAMARDGNFFSWLGAVSPRRHTPARSIACLAGVTLIYVFAAGFRNLLALFTFSVWIFYSLTAVALLLLRRRGVGGPGAWRAPGGMTAPLVVIGTGIFMTTGLVRHDPRQSGIGMALLLAGFAVFAVWRRTRGGAAPAGAA
ncbi:MAG TPA: amino acid permease, partial [Dongiaceae bacterium]|nr:amino acid permease [Dongiaceae bacterium]